VNETDLKNTDTTGSLTPKAGASDHLANERTFLAWIRTAIGIMAFGFVVVKFSLFIKQLSLLIGSKTEYKPTGFSSIAGIILVGLGLLTIVFSFFRYRKTERQLDMGNYRQSEGLVWFITFFILSMGLFLLVYLVKST
jgi:putative membrane protein